MKKNMISTMASMFYILILFSGCGINNEKMYGEWLNVSQGKDVYEFTKDGFIKMNGRNHGTFKVDGDEITWSTRNWSDRPLKIVELSNTKMVLKTTSISGNCMLIYYYKPGNDYSEEEIQEMRSKYCENQ